MYRVIPDVLGSSLLIGEIRFGALKASRQAQSGTCFLFSDFIGHASCQARPLTTCHTQRSAPWSDSVLERSRRAPILDPGWLDCDVVRSFPHDKCAQKHLQPIANHASAP